jgi:hypothetical protein
VLLLSCKVEKPIDEFYKMTLSKDGYDKRCKKCEHTKHLIRQNKPVGRALKREYDRSWYERHRKEKLDKVAEYKRKNIDKQRIYAARYKMKRDKLVRQATPPWAKRGPIYTWLKEIYSNRPEGKQVDHIYPLQGPNYSGLHVPWNLQYLDRDANIRKSNKTINIDFVDINIYKPKWFD